MHAKHFVCNYCGAVVWWAGRGYHSPLTPGDDGLYSGTSSLPHVEERILGLRFQCQQHSLMHTRWDHPGNIWLVDALKVFINVCPSSRKMSALASLIIIRMKFAWSQQTWWAACSQATRAGANGSVSVCFSAAAGKQAPSCQVTAQPRYRPLQAAPGWQRWMHSLYSSSCPVHTSCYGSAVQTLMAQGNGDSCSVPHTECLLPPQELWGRANTRT